MACDAFVFFTLGVLTCSGPFTKRLPKPLLAPAAISFRTQRFGGDVSSFPLPPMTASPVIYNFDKKVSKISYIPIIQFMIPEYVCKSTVTHRSITAS